MLQLATETLCSPLYQTNNIRKLATQPGSGLSSVSAFLGAATLVMALIRHPLASSLPVYRSPHTLFTGPVGIDRYEGAVFLATTPLSSSGNLRYPVPVTTLGVNGALNLNNLTGCLLAGTLGPGMHTGTPGRCLMV